MPKKKAQLKGKPKHATEETDDFRKTISDSEEEYTTVVEYEESKKYSKRLIESNWAKYETAATADFDGGDDGKELPKTDDFNYLIKTASSDCSHFQFNSEKQWQSENNLVPSSKIFNLDLSILSSGLACVPFYKRMGLDESELSIEDRERFDKEANDCLKDYNLLREKSLKKPETDLKVKNLEYNSRTLKESLKDNLNLEKTTEQENVNLGVDIETDKDTKSEAKDCKGDKVLKDKQKIFFSENENLEDWLDSVLDD